MCALAWQVFMLTGAKWQDLQKGNIHRAECWAWHVAHPLGCCTITPCLSRILETSEDGCCADEVSCMAIAYCSPSLKQQTWVFGKVELQYWQLQGTGVGCN